MQYYVVQTPGQRQTTAMLEEEQDQEEEEEESDTDWYDPYDPCCSYARKFSSGRCKQCCWVSFMVGAYIFFLYITGLGVFWWTSTMFKWEGFQRAKWEIASCRVVDAGVDVQSLCSYTDSIHRIYHKKEGSDCTGPDCKTCPLQESGCVLPPRSNKRARRLYGKWSALRNQFSCKTQYVPWAVVEVEADGLSGSVQTCATMYGADEFGCARPGRKYGDWMASIGWSLDWHMLRKSWRYYLKTARNELKEFGVQNDQGVVNVNSTVKCWEFVGEDVAVRLASPQEGKNMVLLWVLAWLYLCFWTCFFLLVVFVPCWRPVVECVWETGKFLAKES